MLRAAAPSWGDSSPGGERTDYLRIQNQRQTQATYIHDQEEYYSTRAYST